MSINLHAIINIINIYVNCCSLVPLKLENGWTHLANIGLEGSLVLVLKSKEGLKGDFFFLRRYNVCRVS